MRRRLSVGLMTDSAITPEEPAASVEESAEVEERPGDVDIRCVEMPVLVGPEGLLKAIRFERAFTVVCLQQSGIAEHAVSTAGADGDDVVEHHEGEPAVAFQGMSGVEVQGGCLLSVLEPPIAGDQRVMLVGQAEPGALVVGLAGGRHLAKRRKAGPGTRCVWITGRRSR